MARDGANVVTNGLGLARDGADVVTNGLGLARDRADVVTSGLGLARDGADVVTSGLGLARDGADVVTNGLGSARDGQRVVAAPKGCLSNVLDRRFHPMRILEGELPRAESGLGVGLVGTWHSHAVMQSPPRDKVGSSRVKETLK
ncbi:MAG: hypothetical protein ACRENE_13120 [Polyangiaceae bacterium]